MKNRNYIVFLLVILFSMLTCKKEQQTEKSITDLKYTKNNISYATSKMDSLQAMNQITKQKIQELFDLSTLYASGNKDTEIDSVIYNQMKTYFLESDTTKINPIILELENLKVRSAKINNVETEKLILADDTLDLAKFDIEYYNSDKQMLGKHNKKATFILKKSPVKFKQEFKFYFIDFGIKDSISVGETK